MQWTVPSVPETGFLAFDGAIGGLELIGRVQLIVWHLGLTVFYIYNCEPEKLRVPCKGSPPDHCHL